MRRFLIPLALTSSLTACTEAPPVERLPVARLSSPIINGSVDNSGNYEEVVAMFTNNSACTGTIIAKDEPFAFVLTAAHCVDENPPVLVLQGTDYESPSAIQYIVQHYQIHPGYNPNSYLNDFAMMRIVGATSATPTRAVLTPAEDTISNGSQFTHLGYGVIDTSTNPDTGTSQRHITTGTVIGTSTLTLTFDASSSGVCFGDSGGPNIHNATGKVAGVNSTVANGNCNTESDSGRASAVLNTFITPYINNAPPPPVNCDACFEAATSAGGACSTEVNACLNFEQCNDLVGCFNGCTSQACINSCAQNNGPGMILYDLIFECICDNACDSECDNAEMCTDGFGPPTSTSVGQAASSADATTTTGVGGSGAGGAGGAGSTSGGQGWFSGNAPKSNAEGTLVSSCSFDAAPARSDWKWLTLAMAGLALARRQRNER